jgi:hypothetical protein
MAVLSFLNSVDIAVQLHTICISQSGDVIVNYEIERMGKKVVMPSFKMLYHHLPGSTKKDHRKQHIRLATSGSRI